MTKFTSLETPKSTKSQPFFLLSLPKYPSSIETMTVYHYPPSHSHASSNSCIRTHIVTLTRPLSHSHIFLLNGTRPLSHSHMHHTSPVLTNCTDSLQQGKVQ